MASTTGNGAILTADNVQSDLGSLKWVKGEEFPLWLL